MAVFTINHTVESSEQTPLPFFIFGKITVHRDKRSAKRLYLLTKKAYHTEYYDNKKTPATRHTEHVREFYIINCKLAY